MKCDDMDQLDHLLQRNEAEVKEFLDHHDARVVCPFYCCFDIRRSPEKAAVVDANAFPAGFNNLNAAGRAEAARIARGYLERNYPGARSTLILAESHTRNASYFEHLRTLQGVLAAAGFQATVGTLADLDGPVTTASGAMLDVHRVERAGDRLRAGGAEPDFVILNNDLSDGVPDLLRDLAQPVNPPLGMGWHRRRKSDHFHIANRLAGELAAKVGFDPWLVTAEFEAVGGLDFKGQVNLDAAALAVDRVLERTRAKYQEHGVAREPMVFVKADAGTYGMGITTATSGEQFLAALNSRGRQEMDRGKGRVKTTQVIVQEAVPTAVRNASGHTAEAVLYTVCSKVAGAFHRVNGERGDQDNLNAPGSRFEPLGFPDHAPQPGEHLLDPCSARVYSVLARLSSLATGYETAGSHGE